MFGRRRRAARAAEARELELRALQLAAPELPISASSASAPSPTTVQPPATVQLSTDAVTALLHHQLNNLIGTDGIWTLVPRTSDDSEVFFHELQAHQIARLLSSALQTGTARASIDLAESPAVPDAVMPVDTPTAAVREDAAPVSTSTLTTPITEPAEPTALPWAPRPVTRWAEPDSAQTLAPARDKAVRR